MRLLIAAAVAAGLVHSPPAAAQDAGKPAMVRSKTTKAHKKKAVRPASAAKKPDDTNRYYSFEKDEMTR